MFHKKCGKEQKRVKAERTRGARRKNTRRSYTALTNLALALILFSVGAACLYDGGGAVTAEGESNVFRRGEAGSDGVSLMFNVYENTPVVYEILDILAKQSAKATFFVGGCWADDNEKCLNAIKDAGHETGNHGYFHKDHASLSLKDNEAEISRCNQITEALTGVAPTLFAPPSGAYGKNTLIAAAKLNMKVILWSKDTIDWRDRNASLIFRRATKNVTGGDFILMHPTKQTAAALKDVLTYYKNHSLRAVTVSENLSFSHSAQ
ncbi:MAG: polysaccharide deacetylase family protein [Candidatus Scatosoma sp.]